MARTVASRHIEGDWATRRPTKPSISRPRRALETNRAAIVTGEGRRPDCWEYATSVIRRFGNVSKCPVNSSRQGSARSLVGLLPNSMLPTTHLMAFPDHRITEPKDKRLRVALEGSRRERALSRCHKPNPVPAANVDS